MPLLRTKLDRRIWNAAVCAVKEAARTLADCTELNADQRQTFAAVEAMCRKMTAANCFPRDTSNAALASKYCVSERTVTNWRSEGCPFEQGQWSVLKWMARRRYVPASAQKKFRRQLDRLRIRVCLEDLKAGFAQLRYIKLLHKLHGLPVDDLRNFRAQPVSGRGSNPPQSANWPQLHATAE